MVAAAKTTKKTATKAASKDVDIKFPTIKAVNRTGVPDTIESKCGKYRVSRVADGGGAYHWKAEVREGNRWRQLSVHFHRDRACWACSRHASGYDPRELERIAREKLKALHDKVHGASPLSLAELMTLIRLERELRGVSQKEAAEQVGISTACWNYLESMTPGRMAKHETLVKMGQAVGIEVGFFVKVDDVVDQSAA